MRYLFYLVFPTAVLASSAWTILGTQDTGVNRNGVGMATLSASGAIYSVGDPLTAGQCPAPTLTIGDLSHGGACVTKITSSGEQVFSVQIGGALIGAIVLDSAGDAYITGSSGPGFTPTPGAYETSQPGVPNSFVCELAANDGHPLFCTYIDVQPVFNFDLMFTTPAFTVDSSGNSYIAGTCAEDPHLCVEQLNPTGTALGYRNLNVTSEAAPSGYPAYVAVDAQSNLFVVEANFGIAKLSASGAVIANFSGFSGYPVALAIDPAGNPELALQDSNNWANFHIQRYTADLSAIPYGTPIVFDTPLFLGSAYTLSPVSGMAVDSQGVTYLWGRTSSANLPVVHPTQACYLPSSGPSSPSGFLARVANDGTLLQYTFLNLLPNFALGSPLVFNSSGASLLHLGTTDWEILQLGPATSEISLSCIGNGASFGNAPLAPNEIVSLFGDSLGPQQPLSAQPGANGIYPSQLGGTQVTFDGAPAPLLYVSAGQINLVTPQSLQGKTTTQVCAQVNGVATNCIDMPVAPAAPAIFSSGQLLEGGTPYALVLNQDGTINSGQNPAPVGSIVTFFATGLGTVTPAVPDGGITPYPPPAQNLNVQTTFTWANTSDGPWTVFPQVTYAGPAPLEVGGLAQFNMVVPPAPTQYFVFSGPSLQIQVLLPGSQTLFYSPYMAIWTK